MMLNLCFIMLVIAIMLLQEHGSPQQENSLNAEEAESPDKQDHQGRKRNTA